VIDPVVIFIEPEEDYSVNLPDTLDVKVEINDDRIIQTVELNIVDENKIPIISGKYYSPGTSQFVIGTSFILEDKTLVSGSYYLMVRASDGINTKDKYLEIRIHEVPARILAYIAVSASDGFGSTITRLNPAFEQDTQFVIPEKYFLAGIHSLWGNFFFIRDMPSVLTAYDPLGFEKEWEMDVTPPRPLITAIFQDKELVFSTANGDAGILSEDGTITLKTSPYTDKTIQCLTADENYIYAAHVSLSGDIHELTVYYRISGSIREQERLPGEIRSLLPLNEKLLVFMQSLTGVDIIEYDPEALLQTEMILLQDENLNAAVKISDSQLFLLTDRCVISYNPSNNQFDDFTDQPYDFCRYDQLSDIIYLARENIVYGFDRISRNLAGEISFPDNVLDFQILYNK
jgi:hypothetical protein